MRITAEILTNEEALKQWIASRERGEEYAPLLVLESAHLERLIYRHAPAHCLSAAVVEALLERAGGSRDPALLLVPLLANPALPARALEQMMERAEDYLNGASSRDFHPEQPGLRWFGILEASGRKVPERIWERERRILREEEMASENRRAWAAYFLMEWGSALEAGDVELAYEALREEQSDLIERLLLRPGVPLSLLRRALADSRYWRARVSLAVASHPEARQDAAIRAELLKIKEIEMGVLLIGSAEEEEVHFWWSCCRKKIERLRLLENMNPGQARTLAPETVSPLLESPEPEMRLRAQIAWSRAQGERKPELLLSTVPLSV